jgi:eukaryotic-like serine/threonine-protein kinase
MSAEQDKFQENPTKLGSREDKLGDLFCAALAKTSIEERGRYLAAACDHDPELRRQLDSLFEAHAQSGDPLHQNVVPLKTKAIREGPGNMVGRYKLLEQIGEGGCGVVYVAE